MSFVTYTGIIDFSSESTARVEITRLYNNLLAAGLVQTSDTGQLVPSAAYPTVNVTTIFGYWIFTYPGSNFYYRIDLLNISSYGSIVPSMKIQVGTSTDGAGNISGTKTTSSFCSTTNINLPTTNVDTYIGVGADFFSLIWGVNNADNNKQRAWFSFTKRCDSNGQGNANGGVLMRGGGQSGDGTFAWATAIRLNVTPKVFSDVATVCFNYGSITSTLDINNNKGYFETKIWFGDQLEVVSNVLGYLVNEIGPYAQVYTNPIGSQTNTYLAMPYSAGSTSGNYVYGNSTGGASGALIRMA